MRWLWLFVVLAVSSVALADDAPEGWPSDSLQFSSTLTGTVDLTWNGTSYLYGGADPGLTIEVLPFPAFNNGFLNFTSENHGNYWIANVFPDLVNHTISMGTPVLGAWDAGDSLFADEGAFTDFMGLGSELGWYGSGGEGWDGAPVVVADIGLEGASLFLADITDGSLEFAARYAPLLIGVSLMVLFLSRVIGKITAFQKRRVGS